MIEDLCKLKQLQVFYTTDMNLYYEVYTRLVVCTKIMSDFNKNEFFFLFDVV